MVASVRNAMRDAYLKKARETYPEETRANLIGPDHTYYGKANKVYYAIGDIGFSDNPVSRQDGPHVWRSPNGTDWEYVGDTGGDICGSVPRSLVRVWGLSCN
jgi:hypothetical protein